MSRAMDKSIEVIKNVAQDIDNGYTIVREIRAQELRAVWINATTKQEYGLGANVMKRLLRTDGDPRIVPVLQFIANQITAVEARNQIKRLENLKVFW